MRHYEMMIIVRDTVSEDEAKDLVDRLGKLVTEQDGEVTKVDYWGRRPLAYPINHRSSGYYTVFDFGLDPGRIGEIERQLQLNDNVVRFKVIRPGMRIRKPQPVREREPA